MRTTSRRDALTLLALGAALVLAWPASAQRMEAVRVADAPDGTPADGATWTVYRSGLEEGPLRDDQGVVGRHAPNWAAGLVTVGWLGEPALHLVETEVPSSVPPRLLAGYFAASGFLVADTRPQAAPDTTLRAIPRPRAMRVGDTVEVEWDPLVEDVPDVFVRWQILHSFDGVSNWTLVQGSFDESVSLSVAEDCAGYYALRPEFIGGVTTSALSEVSDLVDAAAADADGDAACDATDNCLGTFNAFQADHDGDGIGDVCDTTGPPLWIEVRKRRFGGGAFIDVHRTANFTGDRLFTTRGHFDPRWPPALPDHGPESDWDCLVLMPPERLTYVDGTGEPPDVFFLVAEAATGDFGTRSDGVPRPPPDPPCF